MTEGNQTISNLLASREHLDDLNSPASGRIWTLLTPAEDTVPERST